MKRWLIKDIQSLTEEEAKNLSEEQIEYKGHNLYFVDFGGNFGYSMLIFLNGGHLYYANDYALHHEEQKDNHAALKEIYINGAKEKLFSGTDFSEVKNYIDYKRKCYYLCNYYIQQIPQEYVSYVFYMESKEKLRLIANGNIYSELSSCFVDLKYSYIVTSQSYFCTYLTNANKEASAENYDYWKEAFKYEMFNHEYACNWQKDYDVLSCFGDIKYSADDFAIFSYFKELGFENWKKKAYFEAVKEYYKDLFQKPN